MSEKIDLKVTDIIVVSVMNKETGEYWIELVTNRPRWKKDSARFTTDELIRITILPVGSRLYKSSALIFHSMEEFENAINC